LKSWNYLTMRKSKCQYYSYYVQAEFLVFGGKLRKGRCSLIRLPMYKVSTFARIETPLQTFRKLWKTSAFRLKSHQTSYSSIPKISVIIRYANVKTTQISTLCKDLTLNPHTSSIVYYLLGEIAQKSWHKSMQVVDPMRNRKQKNEN
jgi:hypothetical protein